MRKRELSFMNVALCLMVMFIHISSEPIAELRRNSAQFIAVYSPWRLSAFVVQGFVFLSAVKLFNPKRLKSFRYAPFVVSRALKIFVPYVLSVVVYYLFFVDLEYFPFSFAELLKYIFVGNLVSHFYFVIIIFQFYLLMPLWIKLTQNVSGTLAFPAALLISTLMTQSFPAMLDAVGIHGFAYNDRIFTTYLCYWIGGCYFGLHYEEMKSAVLKNKAFVAVALAVSAMANVFFGYGNAAGLFNAGFLENIHFIYAWSAIMALFAVGCMAGEAVYSRISLFRGVDRYSLYIYLFHSIIIFQENNRLYEAGITDLFTRYAFRLAAVYGIVLMLAGAANLLKEGGRQNNEGSAYNSLRRN